MEKQKSKNKQVEKPNFTVKCLQKHSLIRERSSLHNSQKGLSRGLSTFGSVISTKVPDLFRVPVQNIPNHEEVWLGTQYLARKM